MQLLTPSYLPRVPERIAVRLYDIYHEDRLLLAKHTDALKKRIFRENPVLDEVVNCRNQIYIKHGEFIVPEFSLFLILALEEAAQALELRPDRKGFTRFGIPIIGYESQEQEEGTHYLREPSQEEVQEALRNMHLYNRNLDFLINNLIAARNLDPRAIKKIKDEYGCLYWFLENTGIKAGEEIKEKKSDELAVIQFPTHPEIFPASYDLRTLLNAALRRQDFMEAARLRDKINATGELLDTPIIN